MSHEIEMIGDQGQMFSVKETPWHGLGHVLNEAPSIADAINLAGLNWGVDLVPLIAKDSAKDVEHKLVRRSTDGAHLGVVGPRFEPLQNINAFKWFQPFVENGFCSLESAGSLRGGSRVWILAKIISGGDEISIVGDDTIKKYILLAHAHDGSLAIHAGLNPVRVVCMNTLRMAMKQGQLIKLKHTKNAIIALDALRNAMDLANQAFNATAEQYRILAQSACSMDNLSQYIKIVMGYEHETDETISTRGKNIINSIVELADCGIGMDLPNVRGTWWSAYNAVTQFISHKDKKDTDTRVNSMWFGDNVKLNDTALLKAMELCGK